MIIKCYDLFSQLTSGRDWWPQLGPRRVASVPGAFFVSAVMVTGSLTVCTTQPRIIRCGVFVGQNPPFRNANAVYSASRPH